MSETTKNVFYLSMAFNALIGAAAVFKIIKILMDGQTEGVSIKESFKKVKRILKATVICICLSSVVNVIKSYFK